MTTRAVVMDIFSLICIDIVFALILLPAIKEFEGRPMNNVLIEVKDP